MVRRVWAVETRGRSWAKKKGFNRKKDRIGGQCAATYWTVPEGRGMQVTASSMP